MTATETGNPLRLRPLSDSCLLLKSRALSSVPESYEAGASDEIFFGSPQYAIGAGFICESQPTRWLRENELSF